MSGPKISTYGMSARQRKNLRAQWNCLQQSLVCREEIKKTIGHLNGMNGRIQSLLSTFKLVDERTNDCSAEINTLIALQNALQEDCRAFMEALPEPEPLQADNLVLSEAMLEKREEDLAKSQALLNKAVAKQEEIEATIASMDAKAKRGISNIEDAIAEDITGVQSFFITPAGAENKKPESEKKKVQDRLFALMTDAACPQDLNREARSVSVALSRIATNEQLSTFQAITVRPLFQRMEGAIAAAQNKKDEYDKLRMRLHALCSIAGVEGKDLPPDDGNLEQLQLYVDNLENRVVMQTERAYISGCVNEVMSEMGYDMIGNRSAVPQSGKRFRSELYSYSDGTAINVTYDSDGQIAMELGGIDRMDRSPTAEEAYALRDDMESFCSDFEEFEERLKAKGITVDSRVSMTPLSEASATIINLTDYEITSTAPIQEIAVAEKRKKTSARDAMHKEND
jgi:hypothetical protein